MDDRIFYSVACDTAIGEVDSLLGAWLVFQDNTPIKLEKVDGYEHYIISVPNKATYDFYRRTKLCV